MRRRWREMLKFNKSIWGHITKVKIATTRNRTWASRLLDEQWRLHCYSAETKVIPIGSQYSLVSTPTTLVSQERSSGIYQAEHVIVTQSAYNMKAIQLSRRLDSHP